MHIKIKRGLDIPIEGGPAGPVQPFATPGQPQGTHAPKHYSLNLAPFKQVRFGLLKNVGEQVKAGEPLAEDKSYPGLCFAAPVSGTVKEVVRGLKRAIIDIVIEADEEQIFLTHAPLNPKSCSREEIIDRLMEGGLFNRFVQRPFSLLANPALRPRSIFIKAVESAPYTPPAEMQVAGYEEEFQVGIDTLAALTDKLHLVYRSGSTAKAFLNASGVEKHTVEGPHPVANVSVHIAAIDPINTVDECVWAISAKDVVAIGMLMKRGIYYNQRVIAIAGDGLVDSKLAGYFKVTEGISIAALVAGRIPRKAPRLITGDPLMGRQVTIGDYLGFGDTVFCAIPEGTERELLHFFRLGASKYTFSRAYLSGHFKPGRLYPFTTCQHGEQRPFIDSTLYDKVMPLDIPTMQLVKAVMAEDYDLAEQLGLLEVDAEDFALPTFVCPSKMEMVEIMERGISDYAKEMTS